MLCCLNPVDIKNIKDIEDMVLFGVYIRLPGRYFRQYLQIIYIIFWYRWNKIHLDDLFPFHNRSPRKGLVAERALFKRVKKHKKFQRHKRHVKMWAISCRQRFYFRHLFLDQPIFRRKCSFYFEKEILTWLFLLVTVGDTRDKIPPAAKLSSYSRCRFCMNIRF